MFSCDYEEAEESINFNQDEIYTTYELSYDENVDRTFAKAWFNYANATGANIQLSSTSQVQFNGDLLVKKEDTGFIYYEQSYAGLLEEGTLGGIRIARYITFQREISIVE